MLVTANCVSVILIANDLLKIVSRYRSTHTIQEVGNHENEGSGSVAIEVISSSIMTSSDTAHVARCVGGDRWAVSWLPGRTLTGQQAVTAMMLAVSVATAEPPPAGDWASLDDQALELGLTGREAAFMIAMENHDYRRFGRAHRVPR